MKEDDIGPLTVTSVPFFGGLTAFLMILVLRAKVSAAPRGEGTQVAIATQIAEGAHSFLVTEYKYLLVFVLAVAVFIVGVLEGQDEPPAGSDSRGGWQTMICFLVGASLSALTGYMGMNIATETNVKTMEAAKSGLNAALKIAFAGGAVMGFYVVSFGIMGVVILFVLFTCPRSDWDEYPQSTVIMRDAIRYLSGFGFGASAIALFARVAGGIYTKAADVGADLVGKVEANIPEDDPRNPATVADNVGDNVGDVAGMGADLFESFVGSIIACAALANNNRELALPFWVSGFGILAAAIGFWTVSTSENATQSQLLHALHMGVYASSILVVAFTALVVWMLFSEDFNGDYDKQMNYTGVVGDNYGWRYFACVLVGLFSGIFIGEATEYATSYAYRPTKSITEAGAAGGAATVIIQGLGIGMLSVLPPTMIIVTAIIACYELGGVYGIAIAGVGMLSTLGVTLATDAYGPIADNAGGIAEMSPEVSEDVRERTDKLDALGNTTAATGKGFAIGSAVLTALSLMNAFVGDVPVAGLALKLSVTDPLVLSGVMIGAMLPFLFGALTMLSVRKAAGAIIVEVQWQFKNIEGLLEGKPGVVCDHMRCVRLCTQSSVKEMILPGLFAVFTPVSMGLLIGARCLGGLLVGSIASGFMLGVMMSNAGGAWDNSKKYVENEKVFGGKKSDTHKAVVVGDTVGDPFKDTSGPALNILIKLMSVFSLTLAPIFRDDWDTWWEGIILCIVQVILVGIAFYYVWVKDPVEEPKPAVSAPPPAAEGTAPPPLPTQA